MSPAQIESYVDAAAAALGLPLDKAQAQRVAIHLGRTAALARQLDAFAFEVHDEPAEVYRPAPFPGAQR